MRRVAAALAVLLAVIRGEAAPVTVRLPEGNLRGFLILRTLEGESIASGELRQRPKGAVIESRLLLNFKDGSVHDEVATFSQRKVFVLESYRLVERGPSFPTTEVAFDRRTGRYRARTQEKRGDEERSAEGSLEMPADLYNGMVVVLLKNLGAGSSATVQIAVFTPKPRLIKMEAKPEGEGRVLIGDGRKPAIRYLVKLELSGLTGVVASLLGKEPPNLHYWLATGEVPAFVGFQGAMFLNGPVWRLELAPVRWPEPQ